jgi:glycosyltransferase involved in cell wall biosynthesis
MRIAIAAPSSVPFRLGGAERAWNGLLGELIRSTPHQADLIKLPAPEGNLIDVVASYQAFAGLDLSSFDLVITTKYPAWITQHRQHVVYLFHPLRSLYELYPPGFPRVVEGVDHRVRAFQGLLNRRPERELLDELFGRFDKLVAQLGKHHPVLAFPGPLARQVVHFLDRVALDPRHVKRHFALSRTVAGRRDYFPPGVQPEILYLPSSLDGFSCRSFDYLLAASRLEANKRVDLLVEAMRFVKADVSLKIAGTGPELDTLRRLSAGDRRIELLGSLSDIELLEAYADALAVPVVPRNEELGLVSLEAMRSGKPVITCRDSGGPTELVEHGLTGLVTDPTPASIAAAIDQLAADPVLTQRLGAAGRRRAEAFTWHRTVTKLVRSVAPPTGQQEQRSGRAKIVIASTARVHPPRTGAEQRTASLARALAAELDVEIVSLGHQADRPSREAVSAGIVESVVPRRQSDAATEIAEELGLPLDDLLTPSTVAQSPEYGFALARACRTAAMLVLSRPYLQPAVAALPRPMPFVYYSHRAEGETWQSLLRASAQGAELVEQLRTAERRSLLDAQGVIVSTRSDVPLLAEYGISPDRLAVAPLGLERRPRPVSNERAASVRAQWLARVSDGGSVERLIVFLGSRDAPDVEASRQLSTIARELPSMLHVAVGCRIEDLGAEAPPNLLAVGKLTGTLRESLLRAADFSLVPAVHGATRLELAECLAAGLPSVVTPAGAHGLPLEDGVHALVRELDGFPEAVGRLLVEPGLAERLGREASTLVDREFDAAAATGRAVDVVRRAIETKTAASSAASG